MDLDSVLDSILSMGWVGLWICFFAWIWVRVWIHFFSQIRIRIRESESADLYFGGVYFSFMNEASASVEQLVRL